MTRDQEVLELISKEPLSTTEIGEKLGINKRTVKWHLDRLGNKIKQITDLNDTRRLKYIGVEF